MDRLFDESFVQPRGRRPAPGQARTLPVDMYETDEDVVVETALPGVDPEEVDVSVTRDTVTIKGKTEAKKDVEEENYIYRERRYGVYSRSLTLPVAVEVDDADASFENGVLTLRLPKAAEAKPKVIEVKVK
jgi:HSP20 family protein